MANVKTVQHRFLMQRFLCDALMVICGMLLSLFVRFYILPVTKNWEAGDYWSLLSYGFPLFMISFSALGLYGLRDPIFNYDIGKRIIKATLVAVAFIIAINFFLRTSEYYSRALFIFGPFFIICFVVSGRLFLRGKIDRQRIEKKMGVIGTLIVGVGNSGKIVFEKIRRHPEKGFAVVGFIAARKEDAEGEIDGSPILGTVEEMIAIVQQHKIRQVIFAQPNMDNSTTFDLMLELDKEMVESRFVPNLLESHLTDCSFDNLEGLPLFGLKETPLQGMNLVIKNLFDKLVASLILLVGSPIYFGLALWVWIDSGFPILYKQRRMAMDSRTFNMYKFRSMAPDAEKDGTGWTKPGDDRVTRAGRIMRKYNLDELPQLINVWRGDMSLVGPRPERPEWVEEFREKFPHYMQRHSVKAGMTGWAQVHGLRGDTDLQERLDFDLYYIENWNLWLDIKILLMTFKAMKNAY